MSEPSDISAILSSQARFRVLKALWAFGGAMSLRSLEAVTGLAVRSVQVALSGLGSEKVIQSEGRGRSKRYRLDTTSDSAEVLAGIFGLVAMDEIQRRSPRYSKRAKAVLDLSEDMHRLVRNARPSR
jgi:DNA-binding transcriptional ArsR family regulator